ncbi:MAG: extracellular solute-binding protein [Treponema sp.]|nr:extracellular solute-binding protein [Treponema sp.]
MIKSTMKKVVMIALAALMVTSTVTAAKKKGADPYAKIQKEKDPKTKKVYDFKKMSIVIGDWWSDPTSKPSSKQQEDERAWRNWTCTTYNMSIVQKATAGWGSQPQFVSNFCITGGDENYVFIIDGRSANVGVKANLFYDLSKITSVDYTNAKKYDQGVTKKLMKGSSYYAFNWGKPEPKNGMYFNKRILQEAGFDPDLPYDLQKEGKWTWATFEDMCKKLTRDTDNDGVIDVYAMSSFNSEFTYAALDSNGGSIIGRDANGKYFNNAGSEKSMEAWNWIAYMFANYQLPQPEGANWDYFYTAFMNGETAFLADQQYNGNPGGRFGEMADDWGFVCFPLGPSGSGVYRTLHDSNMCVIPSCYDAERANNIAKAVDLWLEPTPGYDGPDAWKEYYYAGYRDSRAVDETLELMAATANPRFDTLISGLNQGDMLWGITGGYQTPQEAYEAAKPVWQGLIDDCNR